MLFHYSTPVVSHKKEFYLTTLFKNTALCFVGKSDLLPALQLLPAFPAGILELSADANTVVTFSSRVQTVHTGAFCWAVVVR